jgi:hypothetical protein
MASFAVSFSPLARRSNAFACPNYRGNVYEAHISGPKPSSTIGAENQASFVIKI